MATLTTYPDSETASEPTLERFIKRLRTQGISNPKVLQAMRMTPRHIFIDEALSSHAYADHALPIGYSQTISQPYIVARMTESLLSIGSVDSVLEVGTGCGYQTAILAQIVHRVYTIERIKILHLRAIENLKSLGLTNVEFKHGDGQWGYPEHAPYQGIIVTAAPATVPEALLDQLAIGGCMVIPIGPQRGYQVLYKIVRTRARYEQHALDDVSFVPLREGLS